VSARHEALQRTEDERVEAVQKTVWVTGCKSWYLDDRGIPAMWPWGIERFREVMVEPAWDDYEVREAAREEVGSG
jgi:hypothetical protein